MEAYRKHREHAGDTIGRMNRGQGHWATVTDDQFSRLRGLPNVPRESGASSERNPEYDRQLLGFDLHHPSLPFWRTVTGGAVVPAPKLCCQFVLLPARLLLHAQIR